MVIRKETIKILMAKRASNLEDSKRTKRVRNWDVISSPKERNNWDVMIFLLPTGVGINILEIMLGRGCVTYAKN